MNISYNDDKYMKLRQDFPVFTYEKYTIRKDDGQIILSYRFNLSDKYIFEPQISIPLHESFNTDNLSEALLNNVAFHIGMVEMISYWKTACPPMIIIKPFSLDAEALKWWKHLFYNGLGEFFYLNNIKPDFESFVSFTAEGPTLPAPEKVILSDRNIIPVGGGKDSAVSYELLTQAGENNMIFFLNPQHLPVSVVNAAGRNELIVTASRTISPVLIQMNKEGFLNGHTPFSALLGFLSLFMSLLSDRRHIILSNESSANEPTVQGTSINHQYSKTLAFESDFRNYTSRFLASGFNYFSFLRPINELQIAYLFSNFPHFFERFRSCNVGSKKGIWCCKCPKCLFTYIMLGAFLNDDVLFQIFGSDLYNDASLSPVFESLTGQTDVKPFDCIGTVDEVNTAVVMYIKRKGADTLPALPLAYTQTPVFDKYRLVNSKKFLDNFDENHFLTKKFEMILKDAFQK